jgi:hypothetical protein
MARATSAHITNVCSRSKTVDIYIFSRWCNNYGEAPKTN